MKLITRCNSARIATSNKRDMFVIICIEGAGKAGHPLKSKKHLVVDSIMIQLNCAGCHNPHGSTGIKPLRKVSDELFSLCKDCYKK